MKLYQENILSEDEPYNWPVGRYDPNALEVGNSQTLSPLRPSTREKLPDRLLVLYVGRSRRPLESRTSHI